MAHIEGHPRIPVESNGLQVNHCKSPLCPNFGVPAEQKSVPGKNQYVLDSRNRGISLCECAACGEAFPLKSNFGIAEELARMTFTPAISRVEYCPSLSCSNYIGQVPVGTVGAYRSYGKTANGNPRWRCGVCGKTFSKNVKATTRQREHHIEQNHL